jgi:MurNAc alpha-1-phosphate uridylyltransferase
LLDTGGGVTKALASLGPAPFFVMNSDSFWTEGRKPALQRMREAWQPDRMDGLLLLAPMSAAHGFSGAGDFHMDEEGRLARRGESETAPFAFAGTSLLNPRLFDEAPEGRFSLNLLFDRALARGRLFGLRHDGLWLHVGTPDAIAEAEAALARL